MGATLQYVGREEDVWFAKWVRKRIGGSREPPAGGYGFKQPFLLDKLFPVCLLPVSIIIIRNWLRESSILSEVRSLVSLA